MWSKSAHSSEPTSGTFLPHSWAQGSGPLSQQWVIVRLVIPPTHSRRAHLHPLLRSLSRSLSPGQHLLIAGTGRFRFLLFCKEKARNEPAGLAPCLALRCEIALRPLPEPEPTLKALFMPGLALKDPPFLCRLPKFHTYMCVCLCVCVCVCVRERVRDREREEGQQERGG